MLSYRYRYQSNNLRDRYIEGFIDYDEYMKQLEGVRSEEIRSQIIDYKRQEISEEIFKFETDQLLIANEAIQQRQKQIAQLARQAEKERFEQQERQKEREAKLKKLKEEEERIKSLSPEERRQEELYKVREQYYKVDAPKLISDYQKEANKYRSVHNNIQNIVIIGSAIITSTTGITIFTSMPTVSFVLKVTSAALSLIVTIVAGFAAYYKFRERSVNSQKAADDIEHEYEAIKLGTHDYSNKTREEAMRLFSDRLLKRIRERKEQQQILEQSSDIKQIPKSI
ncbi:hypothetical protein KDK_24220 [Dictyobacter kobayashii]|uniref:DUF4231 domain-containing protein n=2 Tax=Dictyobacter kobayashii TaxID=2014872 RepID=A0A402AHL7_9CHLR|nr:hypothetical protein KDK_24220 [Dictyobacter kobayashii]